MVIVCVDGCDGDSGIIDGDMVDSCGYDGDSGYDNVSFSCDGDRNCSCEEDQSDDPGIKICFVEWPPACDVLSEVCLCFPALSAGVGELTPCHAAGSDNDRSE